MSKRGTVGFVITPGEIAGKIAALDKNVQALNAQIKRTAHKRIDAGWRIEWDSFLRRWAVERDSYAEWSARLFATRVMPRLEAYEQSYAWWAKDFARRTGASVDVPAARPSESMSASVVPTELWWILGGMGALWVLSKQ